MRNLEQIRAANALNVKIEKDSDNDSNSIAKKVPSMIIENGLLATAAFSFESNKKGYKSVFENGIIPHLASLNRLPGSSKDLEEFIADLSKIESSRLRAITSETMAYLNYLRRFAK